MGRRALLGSAVLFLVLLALTVKVTRKRSEAPQAPFFALQRNIPDTLLVAYGQDTTVLVPSTTGTGWELLRPVRDAADVVVVNALLKRLENLPVDARRFPLTQEKMDTYGMRHPRAMVRAAYRGALKPDTLLVGAFTLSGDFDYVRVGSAPEVSLVEARMTRSYLLKTTLDLRETTLLPFSDSRATNVRLMGPGSRVRAELGLDPDGAWRVKRPFPGPADPRKLREYLLSLNHMHIEHFGPEGVWPLAPYGLALPAAEVAVVTSSGDTVRAAIGDRVPGDSDLCYARSSQRPQLLEVPLKYRDVFLGSVDPLREPAQFGFGLDRVDSVRIECAEGSAAISPADSAMVGRPARTALANWVRLRATGFAPADADGLRRWGLAPAGGRLVWSGGGVVLAVVDIGGSAGGRLAVRVSGGQAARPDEILLLPATAVAPLWNALREQVRASAGAP